MHVLVLLSSSHSVIVEETSFSVWHNRNFIPKTLKIYMEASKQNQRFKKIAMKTPLSNVKPSNFITLCACRKND